MFRVRVSGVRVRIILGLGLEFRVRAQIYLWVRVSLGLGLVRFGSPPPRYGPHRTTRSPIMRKVYIISAPPIQHACNILQQISQT